MKPARRVGTWLFGPCLTLLALHAAPLEGQVVQAVPAPSNLTAESVSPSRIDLEWTGPSTGLVTEYRVYYSDGTLRARVAWWQRTYSDTGLQSWTEYGYYVRSATLGGNLSGPSNEATARTQDGTPPSAPGGFGGVATSATEIALTWTSASDPESGIAGYVVYRDGTETGETTERSFTDGALQADRVYEYRVRARNGQGTEGPAAGPIEVQTLEDRPDPPRDLTALARGTDRIDLDWREPADDDDIDGYRVYRDGSPIASTSSTDYQDTGLAPFTTYAYRVTALSEGGDESDPSNEAAATTQDASPPTTPSNLAAVAAGPSRIDLAWSPSSDPESGVSSYVVYREGIPIGTASDPAYADEGLSAAVTYEYRVAAVNGDDLQSGLSDPASATTLDGTAPSTPTELTALAVSFDQIDLNWTASADPESGVALYRVFRDGAVVGTSTVAGFQDPGLTPATTYSYRVSAVNGEGLESELSEASEATTLDEPGPPAPADLAARPLNQTQIELSWTTPAAEVTGYNIYRDGAFIGSVTTTTFVDTGLLPDATYRYAVASLSGEIQGERSGEIQATTYPEEDRTPPAPPSGLRLIAP